RSTSFSARWIGEWAARTNDALDRGPGGARDHARVRDPRFLRLQGPACAAPSRARAHRGGDPGANHWPADRLCDGAAAHAAHGRAGFAWALLALLPAGVYSADPHQARRIAACALAVTLSARLS